MKSVSANSTLCTYHVLRHWLAFDLKDKGWFTLFSSCLVEWILTIITSLWGKKAFVSFIIRLFIHCFISESNCLLKISKLFGLHSCFMWLCIYHVFIAHWGVQGDGQDGREEQREGKTCLVLEVALKKEKIGNKTKPQVRKHFPAQVLSFDCLLRCVLK